MFVFYDWPFPHVYFAKNVAYFRFNSWLSFQRLCHLLRGLIFSGNPRTGTVCTQLHCTDVDVEPLTMAG